MLFSQNQFFDYLNCVFFLPFTLVHLILDKIQKKSRKNASKCRKHMLLHFTIEVIILTSKRYFKYSKIQLLNRVLLNLVPPLKSIVFLLDKLYFLSFFGWGLSVFGKFIFLEVNCLFEYLWTVFLLFWQFFFEPTHIAGSLAQAVSVH